MSFILDALRKSEAERQQNSGAEFAAVPSSPGAPPVPRWLWIVGLLLAVNFVVLLGLLLQTDEGPEHAVTDLRQHPPESQRQVPPSFEDQVNAARRRLPGKQELPAAVSAARDERPAVQAVLISQDPSSVPPDKLYPSILEMRANGSLDIPELHLDIHVFSAEPENRFVFINMVKLREGSQLHEGPVITEITAHGVMLKYQGNAFLLPRR